MADKDKKEKKGVKGFGGKAFMGGAISSVFETQNMNLEAYLPKEDLVGGSVPYIPGAEDEAVWNAASQSCGTERVHYTYAVDDGKVWYLATPSAALASNPDSWCPLAAALPGNSEYWDKDSVYIFEQEGTASAIRWDKEAGGKMQVYLGASRVLLPRLQSLDSNFITINAEMAEIVPWKNLFLNRERLSRVLVKLMFLTASFVTICSVLMWMGTYIFSNSIEPNLKEARDASMKAANDLMVEAVNAYHSTTDKHLARIIELLNETGSFGGVLTKYEVKKDGSVEWTALIPSAVKPEQIKAKAIGSEGDRIKIQGNR